MFFKQNGSQPDGPDTETPRTMIDSFPMATLIRYSGAWSWLPYSPDIYEGYSKINFRLVGKNKRVVTASKRTLSSKKEFLFLLYAYPHTFSPRSVGVNTDKTWTLSSPLPPAVRYVL